jgi:hypothetical protein
MRSLRDDYQESFLVEISRRVTWRVSGRGPNGYLKTHFSAQAGEEIDERVRAEQVDTPAKEIAHAGLRYAKNLGRGLLLQTAGGDELLHLNHEVGADQQMFGFLAGKADVSEDIAGGFCHFELHGVSPHVLMFRSTLSQEGLIALPCEIDIMLRRFSGPFWEGMEHVDGICKLCHVTHTVFHGRMHSDLIYARANRRHRFEVCRVQTLLDLPELKTG